MIDRILTLEFTLNNNGFQIFTYWFDLAMPMRTILLLVTVWAGVKLYRLRNYGYDKRSN